MIERIAETHPSVVVVNVDIDSNGAFADEFSVRSIPSILMFKSGECVDRLVGKIPYIMLERAVAKLQAL